MTTPDSVYLTPIEWQAMGEGIDFTDLANADQLTLIARAEQLINATLGLPEGGSLLLTSYIDEQHDWRQTRRVYFYNQPVISVEGLRLRVGASTYANIPLNSIYLNKTQNYAEVTSLALALGVTPDILNLGLFQAVVETDYTAGYSTIPLKVKQATAIIASAGLVAKLAWEQGDQGAISYSIGAYQVTFASSRITQAKSSGVESVEPQAAGFANYVPEAAKTLLRPAKRIFLR